MGREPTLVLFLQGLWSKDPAKTRMNHIWRFTHHIAVVVLKGTQ
jgi:hypothetical protein